MASESLTSARMSYAAAVLGCVTYGMYFILAAICIHFLWKRHSSTHSQSVILAYTIVMLIVSTIYFISASVWSEVEFVESTVDISVFDTLLDSRLAILKDTSYTVNIWLADSLIIYRVFIVWSRYIPIIVLPSMLWAGTVATGIGLLVSTAKPLANLDQETVINYQTAFYCLTVSHNIICTLMIATRLSSQQRALQKVGQAGRWSYSAVIAIIVESAALYSVCGIVYIPLVIRMLPLQYPITALIGSLTSIAPNLIILRIALGTAISSEQQTLTSPSPSSGPYKLSTFRTTATGHSGVRGASRTLASASDSVVRVFPRPVESETQFGIEDAFSTKLDQVENGEREVV